MARHRTPPDGALAEHQAPVADWFAINLKAARLAQRLSLADLGERINMDRGAVWRIERKIHHSTIKTANDLANALGFDLVDLLVSPVKFSNSLK